MKIYGKNKGMVAVAIWRVNGSKGGTLLEKVLTVRDATKPDLHRPIRLPGAFIPALRLVQAVRTGETIAVFGDYDCDGVCAAAVMAIFLGKLGIETIVRLPTRDEGYGLRPDQVKELVQKGAGLIVTVDNGISAHEAARVANNLGIDMIVTDHHEPSKILPDAPHIVNPKLNGGYRDYSGAGVAYLLCCEVARILNLPEPSELLDLVALATVVDVCPITRDNFILSRRGLLQMRQKQRPGVAALMEAAKAKKLGGYSLGWQLGPRINAAGRMADPMLAYRLIIAESRNEALSAARDVDRLNTQRKEIVEKVFKECLTDYNDQAFPVFVTDYLNVAPHTGAWIGMHGIVGVVAGRLAEKLCRPVLVGSLEGDTVRASGRTTGGFDLLESLRECQEETGAFIALGGHKKAAGVTFEKKRYSEIVTSLDGIARLKLKLEDIIKFIDVDAAITGAVRPDEVAELDVLEPFGEENPEPTFLIEGHVNIIRQNCQWTLASINGIKFFAKPGEATNGKMQMVANLRVNEEEEIMAHLVDMRPC